MLAIREPSSTSATGIDLGGGMARGLLSRDAAERGADRHADSRDVALAQHVARHDLAGGEDVSRRAIVLPEHQRERAHGVGLNRREHRRNKLAHRFSIDDRVCELIGLRGDKPAPDRVALGPEVEAFVVEALRVAVDDDAERYAIDAGANAAVELRRAGVDRNAMPLGRIADGFRAAVAEDPQDTSHVVW